MSSCWPRRAVECRSGFKWHGHWRALDVFIVRKLGVPGHKELAMGAIASGGVQVLNDDVVRHLRDAEKLIPFTAEHEWRELRRREEEYRDGRPAPNLAGKTVILVDDGLATSSTMRAAVLALRKCDVAALVVAVPIGAPEIWVEFQHEVDEAICLAAPPDFQAVGQFYEDFSQTTDQEVRELLARAEAHGVRA